jgi:hypothetical protein
MCELHRRRQVLIRAGEDVIPGKLDVFKEDFPLVEGALSDLVERLATRYAVGVHRHDDHGSALRLNTGATVRRAVEDADIRHDAIRHPCRLLPIDDHVVTAQRGNAVGPAVGSLRVQDHAVRVQRIGAVIGLRDGPAAKLRIWRKRPAKRVAQHRAHPCRKQPGTVRNGESGVTPAELLEQDAHGCGPFGRLELKKPVDAEPHLDIFLASVPVWRARRNDLLRRHAIKFDADGTHDLLRKTMDSLLDHLAHLGQLGLGT